MPQSCMSEIASAARGATIRRRISWPIRSADRSRKPSRARIAAESPVGIIGFRAELGVEAEEAEDAEPVLGDPPVGVADEADTAGNDVGIAAERIVDDAGSVDRKRIDGEIAPAGIRLPVAAEADDGAAAVGLDILAERRHLVADAVGDERQRAVLDAGRHDLEARLPRRAPRRRRASPWWRNRCRRPARPEAHRGRRRRRSAPRRRRGRAPRRSRRTPGAAKPVGAGEAREGLSSPLPTRPRYSKWPGTSTPSITCAGRYVLPAGAPVK